MINDFEDAIKELLMPFVGELNDEYTRNNIALLLQDKFFKRIIDVTTDKDVDNNYIRLYACSADRVFELGFTLAHEEKEKPLPEEGSLTIKEINNG